MTWQESLKYCFFYKGEAIIPTVFEGKDEGQLWVAEKFVCEEISNQIDEESPRESMASWVAAYVSKWNPYGYREVLDLYLKHIPDLKEYILKIYN